MLVGKRLASRYVARILAKQDAEKVFLLFNLLLERRNFRASRKYQLLGLAYIEERSRSAVCQESC